MKEQLVIQHGSCQVSSAEFARCDLRKDPISRPGLS